MGRILAESAAACRSFLRRRTAVFFTFFFPVLLIAIFAGLIRTQPTGGGLFSKPPGYYLPAYLAAVVLFTPLSRLGSTVARHREGSRFEKLATTPLSRGEWLVAHTLVNGLLIGLASALLLVALTVVGADFALSPLLVPFIALAVVTFCGVGALIGRLAGSQDGAISMSNAIALPLLFLSDTFVPPSSLPAWFRPVMELSPLTYFARGVRAVTYYEHLDYSIYIGRYEHPELDLLVLAVLAVVFFVAGAYAIPWTD